MPEFGHASEIGRPLKVSELNPKTIVILNKGETFYSIWVLFVRPELVFFTSGVARTDLCLRRVGDGKEELVDDNNTPIRVFEYLGEP